MIKVFLGSNLKNFTNGVEELEVEATSVKSLIRNGQEIPWDS